MGFKCGIIGLPNVGKSTLFNALTHANVPMENYPFCTIDPHIGVVEVPDKRLKMLGKIYKPQKLIPTTLEFVDIAGLVEGASKGEGLGNQFLSNIQSVDAIIHMLRCFDDPNVVHKYEDLDPNRDFRIVEAEIIKKDLEIVQNRLQKIKKQAKSGMNEFRTKILVLEEIEDLLKNNKPVKNYHHHSEERPFIKELGLLSNKPMLILGNISEDEAGSDDKTEIRKKYEKFALESGNFFLTLSANLELELARLDEDERAMFMKELNIKEIGLQKLIGAGYGLLDLITYYTIESDICQAWTVKQGTHADKAAAVIHTSFEQRFIKAEVRRWKDVEKVKSERLLHDTGHIQVEGKSYQVRDGDVITYKLARG